MALESTDNYVSRYDDEVKELPPTGETHAGFPCIAAQVDLRTIKGETAAIKRKLIIIHFVCFVDSPEDGVKAGARHSETFFVDDKYGEKSNVPRKIVSNIVRTVTGDAQMVDFEHPETIAAYLLGRPVRLKMKDAGQYGTQIQAVVAVANPTAARAAADKWDAETMRDIDSEREQHAADLDVYKRTNVWPGAAPALVKPGAGFSDDHVPLTTKPQTPPASDAAIDEEIPF